MSKEKNKKGELELTIFQAIPHLGLNSQEKFVCLRVFDKDEKHSIEDWEKLLKQKKVR